MAEPAPGDDQDKTTPESDRGVVVGIDVGGTKTAMMATDVASGRRLATATRTTDADG